MIEREWYHGDEVEIVLPIPVERTQAHPMVRMNAGKVALQRGPIVYCLEEVDNESPLSGLILPLNAELVAKYEEDLLGGVVAITGPAMSPETSDWRHLV